jgi:subtilase family serine protease
MKRPFATKLIRLVSLFCGGAFCGQIFGQTAGQSVPAHVPAVAKLAQPLGRMQSTEPLSFAITLPLRNRETLTNLLRDITNPTSANYRHYLTREEFTERFGPTEEDYNAVKDFARANRLNVRSEHANRMLLEVHGTVGDIERALHTTVRMYRHPSEARTFYAPETEPSLEIKVPVLSIRGLDNFALAQPRLRKVLQANGQNAAANGTGSGPNGGFRGNDFRAAYVPGTTLTGAGQIVGLLQFDGYSAADIANYEAQAGLPSVTLSNVLLNGASGLPSNNGNNVTEVSMDIETTISMAPGLAKVILYIAPNPSPFEVILNRMVSDNLARQLSCSWYVPGGSANPAADQIFQEMAAQGQSFFNASGDADAYTSLIDFPSDSPFITQVGGTTLTTDGAGGVRISEAVWNWGNGAGSGGGISTQYGIPWWQTNINMSANQGSTTMRNVPDVALTAENVYVRVNGGDITVAGTSCSAPLWAGFAALINEKAAAAGQPPIGFINPTLDKLASAPNYATHFSDITNGNNTKLTSPTKFFATDGYDLCTGWGTPIGQALIDALAIVDPLQVVQNGGFSAVGGVGGPFTVTAQSLTVTNAGTNALTWTVTKNVPWLTVSGAGGTLSAHTSAMLTVGLNSAASNLMVGTYAGSLWFTNVASELSFERQYTLTILSPPIITTQPANATVLDGDTATFSATAAGDLPLFYQWRLNGTNIFEGGHFSGVTTSNLTVSNVSPAVVGTYSVVVTNAASSTISSNALLSIVDSEPVITLQPADQTVVASKTATFRVAAIGTKPFTYQWRFAGAMITDIDGATNNTLTLTNTQLGDAGGYWVTVSNAIGGVMSSPATLTVVQLPIITSFAPRIGMPGTNVTITGVNFSSVASNNVVFFGAVRGVVMSASETNLVVTVPLGATLAPITVMVNGLSAFTSQPFVPVFPGTSPVSAGSLVAIPNLPAGSGPVRVCIADLNGDGKPDLVASSALDGIVSIYQNVITNGTLAASSFAPQRVVLPMLSTSSNSPIDLAIADVDGDGKLDILATDSDGGIISIFRNIGTNSLITSNSFADRFDMPADIGVRGLAVLDLNQDGKPEIVTGNIQTATVSIFENFSTPGIINFAPAVDLSAAAGPCAVAIADADGDGNPDLVIANNGSTNAPVSIFRNPGIAGDIDTNSFSPRIDFTGNSSAESLAVGDLDGDGKADIVTGSPAGHTISVYRNISSPGGINSNSFAAPVNFGGGGAVTSVALADVDGDRKLDVTFSAENAALSVYRNISTPGYFTTSSLATRVDFGAGESPNGVALGDLNGDGRPDAVFGNFDDNTLSVYRNNSTIVAGPVITVQPADLAAAIRSNATFSVTVFGTTPFTYQWYRNETNKILGATNSILTLTNIQVTNATLYHVVISNSFGMTISSNAILTVTGFDHFAWSPIPSPRFVNNAFAVTVLAMDTTNAVFTNFTGTVSLSSTNGVPVNPQVSDNFVDGVWSGTISVSQTISNLVLRADDGDGRVGTANAIDVVNTPAIQTSISGDSLTVSWPIGPAGFVLEMSDDLTSGSWTPVPGSPTVYNGWNRQTVPVNGANQFFRLRFEGP